MTSGFRPLSPFLVLSLTTAIAGNWVNAQPITPANDGTGTIVTPEGHQFHIHGGQRSADGANLFHSFEEFGLDEGQIGNFLSDPNLENILGRVTGGEASFINGLLQVTGGNSNLFLLNPAGILFGPNASLNVPADFTATTATGIGFENGWFHAVGETNWSSLVGNPNAFDFSTVNPGAIVNEGNLVVPPRQNLSLIGGTVVNTGTLQAAGGNITVIAVPGENLVRFSVPAYLLSLEVSPRASTLPFTPLSLPELLTGNSAIGHASRVTVNSDGTIAIGGSGVSIDPQSGDAIVSGLVDVSDRSFQAAESVRGGKVKILGDRIGLFEARIDASGTDGGGEVLIGTGSHFISSFFDKNSAFPNALRTWIDGNSFIFANGKFGGRVTIQANEVAGFYGEIEATGVDREFSDRGQRGYVRYARPGGSVTVSGKDHLIFEGSIDVGGDVRDFDDFGILTLSSSNITVSEGTSHSTPTEAAFPNIFQYEFADRGLVLNAEVLDRQTGEVELSATEDLTVATSLTFDPTRMWIGQFTANSDDYNAGSFSSFGQTIRTGGRPISIWGESVVTGTIDTSLEGGNGEQLGSIEINSWGNLDIAGNLIASGNISLWSYGGDITTRGDLISRGFSDTRIALASDLGNITIAGSLIAVSDEGYGGDITTRGDLISRGFSDTKIYLASDGNITIAGSLIAVSDEGGNIYLKSRYGSIDATESTIESLGRVDRRGTVELIASRDIGVNTINIVGGCDISPCNGTISLNTGGDLTVFGTLDPGFEGTQNLIAGGNLNWLGEGKASSGSLADDIADFSGNIYLEAEGDVTIDTPINANESIQIRAGRSLNINADINTADANGNIVLRANDEEAAALGTRPPGAGSLTQVPETTLSAGSGDILFELGNAGEVGNLTIGNVNTSGTVVAHSNGGNIYRAADNSLVRAGAAVFQTGGIYGSYGSGIGTPLQPIQIEVGNLEAQAWNGGVFFESPTSVTIGGVTDRLTGISTLDGGDIVLVADGSITAIEEISTSNVFVRTGDIILESRTGVIDVVLIEASDLGLVRIDKTDFGVEGSSIRLVAPNGITVNSLRCMRSIGYLSGEIALTSSDGDIYTGSLNANDGIVFNAPKGHLVIGYIDFDAYSPSSQIVFNVGGIITFSGGGIDNYQDIIINSPVNLLGDVWLKSSWGHVFLNGSVDGNHNLVIEAERVQINENIGQNNPLNHLKIGRSFVGRSFDLSREITTQDIHAEGGIFLYGEEISTGVLNTSSPNGGGNVTLEADGNITVPVINAQSLGNGIGGDANITAYGFFRATDSFFDRNGIDASISTAGGEEGGSIQIRHGGGGIIPFVVGDASTNGTAGAITRGNGLEETISSGEFYLPHSQDTGRISIAPIDELPFPDDRVPLERLTVPGDLETQITPDRAVRQIEQRFEAQFEEYLGENFVEGEDMTAEVMRETLRTIEAETGEKAAIIYALTVPPKALSEGIDTEEEQLTLMLVLPDGSPIVKTVTQNSQPFPLKSAIYPFLHHLRNPYSNDYQLFAQTLYQWLIQPLEGELAARDIDTLIFSMDEGLRQIPLAALHDGQQFLVEKYNLGLLPSLSLTDTRYQSLHNDRVLAMGMSEFSNNSPLPAVPVELATIVGSPQPFADRARKSDPQTKLPTNSNGLWPGEFFLNEEFTLDNLIQQRQQQPYQIIHLATHAHFNLVQPDLTHIQFWDERLSLDELRQVGWSAPPMVELLVLSACETAVGDKEAEMGWAGLALRAGVKSVLASLWQVNDTATFALMSQFYHDLRETPIKAEALRQAQLAMLRGEVRLEGGQLIGNGVRVPLPPELGNRYGWDLSHPYYWAGFTMVGSPW